jgi:cell division protein ZapA (FtsZ GTPase activity inhibitor)
MSDVTVKVEIAGGLYTLKIKNEDESNVKQAVELINQKISEFERNYGVKDKKDLMAMVALQLVSQLAKEKNQAKKELSTLKLVLEDVEQMLVQHKDNIQKTEE